MTAGGLGATDDLGAGDPPPAMAGGRPVSDAVADQAARWLTLLMSGEAREADRQGWRQWRAADPDHERAWTHIEAVTGRLRLIPSEVGQRTLSGRRKVSSPGRRSVLLLVSGGGAAGVLAWAGAREGLWTRLAADLRTGVGEQRTVTLADGSRLMMNTATAVDVRFDAGLRLVKLLAGEIRIETAAARGGAPDLRPFEVGTGQGRIRALGTRFTVRRREARTEVAVAEHAVEVRLAGGGAPRILHAGERAVFSTAQFEEVGLREARDEAWVRGQIVAEDLRLDEFLRELGRYRPGLVRCDPGVAALRLSGVFPLQDSDRILDALPGVLPVRVRRLSAYWVKVGPV